MTEQIRKSEVSEQISPKLEHLKNDTVELETSVQDEVFEVIPEEMWLQILDKLVHSKDVLNVLTAFPVLDMVFGSKKAYWLFDQVLPHLMTKHLVFTKDFSRRSGDYLYSEELLKLRLISKRWKKIVESSIQNYAYQSINSGSENDKHSSAAVSLPANHFNNNRITSYHLGASVFGSHEQITDFLNEMANFKGNPFPGKFVHFEDINDEDVEDAEIFLKKAVELLQKFGKHVLHLSWQINDFKDDHSETYQAILEGLDSVPNLKSLKLFGYLHNCSEFPDEDYFQAENMDLMPKLGKLESFECEIGMGFEEQEFPLWMYTFVNFYGGRGVGLRKLALHYKHWNAEMAANLNKLTTINFLLRYWEDYDINGFGNALRAFPKGQLKKFCLNVCSDFDFEYNPERVIYIDDILGMLEEFEIEDVSVKALELREKGNELGEVGITSLHLDDCNGLTYEFLKRLPKLRFLSVRVPTVVMEGFNIYRNKNKLENNFSFKLRQYFWRAYEELECKENQSLDIWKECGKLEMLSVSLVVDEDVMDVQYVREYGNKPFFGWSARQSGEVWVEEYGQYESYYLMMKKHLLEQEKMNENRRKNVEN